MRLRILEDGSWEISMIREIELYFLNQIREAADPGEDELLRRRLFPNSATEAPVLPAGKPAARKTPESDEDDEWGTLVVPELRSLFGGALCRVEDDLSKLEVDVDGAQEVRIATQEEPEESFRLAVPSAHADQWFSALNQARIVLAQRFDLPTSDDQFVEEHPEVDERWLAFAQANLYAFIQTFLLENVMLMPGGGGGESWE